MKIEAKTLDEAIIKASQKLGISAAALKYDLIQRPSNGFLGLFRKNAIIQVSKPVRINKKPKPAITNEILQNIKQGVQSLLDVGLYDLSISEICIKDDYVYVKLDGPDRQLAIGKEGKRYKALSYMLHNWAILKYDVFLRLEIGEYLSEQIAELENYIIHVIDKARQYGRYTTRPLDGALLKVVLDRLRQEFPDKYVGIKNQPNGSKAVLIGDFISSKSGD